MADLSVLEELLKSQLKPLVKKIDCDAYYPREFLLELGKNGLFSSAGQSPREVLRREMAIVEQTAELCMTTAFNIWCHLAALTYLRTTENPFLKENVLPLLENGENLGATGLSNPMKYYAGLETLHLSGSRTDGGFILSGTLPAVSNLHPEHWFGAVADIEGHGRVMFCVNAQAPGLKLKEKVDYLGLNGSATYACSFNRVFIPDRWVLSEDGDAFVASIRPKFLMYQIPLGFGVTAASIESIHKVCKKQGGCNQFLRVQPDELEAELEDVREKADALSEAKELAGNQADILQLRLQTVYLTSKAAHASMLHQGSAGYIQSSPPSRRLRESYFLVNLSPTIRHLEKVLQENGRAIEESLKR